MIYGMNVKALERKQTFPDSNTDRITCCRNLKTEALRNTLSGEWPRWKFNHTTDVYEIENNGLPFTGVIVGNVIIRIKIWLIRMNRIKHVFAHIII